MTSHALSLVRAALRAPARLRAALFVEVRAGDRLPAWYGLAWVLYERNAAVASPIPLNIAFHRARLVWFWLKRGGRVIPLTPPEAFEAGLRHERAKWMQWMEDPLG